MIGRFNGGSSCHVNLVNKKGDHWDFFCGISTRGSFSRYQEYSRLNVIDKRPQKYPKKLCKFKYFLIFLCRILTRGLAPIDKRYFLFDLSLAPKISDNTDDKRWEIALELKSLFVLFLISFLLHSSSNSARVLLLCPF